MARYRRRRRSEPSGAEVILAIFSTPWWVRALIGLGLFVFLHVMATALQTNPLWVVVAGLVRGLGTFLLGVFAIAAAIGLLQELVTRRAHRDAPVVVAGSHNVRGQPVEPKWQQTRPPRPGWTDTQPLAESVSSLAPKIPELPMVGGFRQPIRSAQPAKSKPVAWSLALLREMEWKRFEEVSAAYFRELGLISKTIRCGADGGVDATLYAPGSEEPVAIVQCKAWNSYTVGVKPVRELLGVMAAQRVPKGIFMATGRYTAEALQFAQDNPLELMSGEQILSRIAALTPESQQRLLVVATEGDYMVPTCPSCGIKMVAREGRDGKPFWGCRNFPRGCRQRFQIRSHVDSASS